MFEASTAIYCADVAQPLPEVFTSGSQSRSDEASGPARKVREMWIFGIEFLFPSSVVAKVVGEDNAPGVVTIGFIALWYLSQNSVCVKSVRFRYAVNVAFNLTNKSIYKFFPFPWTVSTIHVLVGAVYCGIAYLLGAKKASFGRVRKMWSNKSEMCGVGYQ